VGEAYFTNYGGTSHAFLYANGLWEDLNDLIPQTSGLVLKWASGINDRGEIAGTATVNGQDAAYLL
jgi:probable HAF family extracellular repeat protein